MAPVGYRSASGVGASNPTSIAKPSGVVEGDLLVLCQVDDSDSTLAQMGNPTGGASWGTPIFTNSTAHPRMKIWWKIAGASEPASYGISGSSGADRNAALVAIPAGTFDPSNPIFSAPSATTNVSNVTAHPCPSVNSVVDGLLITFHAGGRNTNVVRTYSPPSGMTERIDTNATSGYSGWTALEANTLALTAGGTTGVKTATISAATQHCSVAMVIRPAPAVAAPVADAGADASVTLGSTWSRTGTGTNTPTSYSWSLTTAPGGVTTGVVDSDANLDYTPTVAGTYVFTLSATNAGGTGTDTVTLTVTALPSGGTTEPAIRSLSSASSGTTSQSTNKPAGLAVDDYLLALQAGDADTTALTAAGFSPLTAVASDSATNVPRGTLWGKFATSDDVAAATFPFGCTSTATPSQTVTLLAIKAGTFDPNNPVTVNAWRTQTRGTAGTGVALQTADSVSALKDQMVLGLFVSDANGNQQTFPATTSGMDLVNSVQAANGYSMHAIYEYVPTADGATGDKTVTPTGTNTSNGWATQLVAINPAPVLGDPTGFFLAG